MEQPHGENGLAEGSEFLCDSSIPVATIVLDHHNQIAKYTVEEKPEIEHLYDVWYISKGMLQ